MSENQKPTELNRYARAMYGNVADSLTDYQLWQIVDHLSPFVLGGPERAKSTFAEKVQNQALELLASRASS